MATVRIARSDDEIGTIDESELKKAEASGFRRVDDAEAAAIKKRREAQSAGGMVQGGAEAVVRGASLGFSDPLLRAAGVDAEGLAARQQNLGTLGTGLEVAGAIAPSLVSGGGGAAATAARLTPAGLAARGGAALGRGTAGRLGGGAAARVVGGAAGASFEGMVGGAGQAASEAALGDRDLAAEEIFAGAGRGAGYGALLGGATSGLGLGLSAAYRGSKPVARGLVEKALGAADALPGTPNPGGLLNAAARKQVTTLSRAAGYADDVVAENVAAVDRYLGRTRDKGGRRLLDLAEGPSRRVDEAVGKAMQPHVAGADPSAAVKRWASSVDTLPARKALAGRAKGALGQLDGLSGPNVAKLRRALRTEARTVASLEAHEAGRARLDKILGKMEAEGDAAFERAQAAVSDYATAARDPLIFGKGIEAREAVVAAQAAERKALAELAPKARASLTGGELDLAALGKSDPAALAKVLDARAAQLDALERVGQDVGKMRTSLQGIREGLRLRQDVSEAAADIGRLRDLERTPGGEIRGGLEVAGKVGGAVLGGLSFGGSVLGEAVGKLAGMATRPASAMRVVARVRGGIDAVRARQGAAIKAFANLADRGAAAAGKAARASGRAAARVAPAVARKAHSERRDKILGVAQRVARLSTDPAELADALGEDMAYLHAAAPEVGGAVAAQAARAVAYLSRVAPPTYTPTLSGAKPMVDPFALDAFGRRLEAVQDPLGTIDLLGRGAMTREHAEALAAVYPRLYAGLQEQILETIGERVQPGGPGISFAARMQMGLIGGVVTDDSLRPEIYAQIQATMTDTAPPTADAPAQLPGPPPVAAENVTPPPQSQWQRLEGGV